MLIRILGSIEPAMTRTLAVPESAVWHAPSALLGKRIAKVEDVVNVGSKIRVEIADIDARGKISLIPVEDEAPAAEAAPAEDTAAE